jgi:hypothetical protein
MVLSLVGLLFIVPVSQAKDVQAAQKNGDLVKQVRQTPEQAINPSSTISSILHGFITVIKFSPWGALLPDFENLKNAPSPPALDGGDNGCIKLEDPGSQRHCPGAERPFHRSEHTS